MKQAHRIFLYITILGMITSIGVFAQTVKLPLEGSQHPQQMDQWCWAGCAHTMIDYYNLENSISSCIPLKQCNLVSWDNNGNYTSCCPTSCNSPNTMNAIEAIVEHWKCPDAQCIWSPLTATQIKSEIDSGDLFVIFITGHFMCGYGYDNSGNGVYYWDVWAPNVGAWKYKTRQGLISTDGWHSSMPADHPGDIRAAFTFVTYTGTNYKADFTDTSVCTLGSIAKWEWTFGDGGTSTLKNPSHTYASPGTYSVKLKITNNQSPAKTSEITQSVTVPKPYKVGYNDIYTNPVTFTTRRAVQAIMPENGTIQSITLYHDAGSGPFLMGVYSDASDSPGNRLAVTAQGTLSSTTGWQTLNLTTPLYAAKDTKIWLAMVFQTKPNVYYTNATTAACAEATGSTWTDGLPAAFGTVAKTNHIYSIYGTYTVGPQYDFDIDSDGTINFSDVTYLSEIFTGTRPSIAKADVNKDGVINSADLVFEIAKVSGIMP